MLRLLGKWGHTAEVAGSGLEATRRLREREQREGRGRTTVVALTARAIPGDEDTCRRARMDGYLRKPLRAEELQALLQSLPYPMKRRRNDKAAPTTGTGAEVAERLP